LIPSIGEMNVEFGDLLKESINLQMFEDARKAYTENFEIFVEKIGIPIEYLPKEYAREGDITRRLDKISLSSEEKEFWTEKFKDRAKVDPSLMTQNDAALQHTLAVLALVVFVAVGTVCTVTVAAAAEFTVALHFGAWIW